MHRSQVMVSPYLPMAMQIEDVVTETDDKNIKTFSFSFANSNDRENFIYSPGQFVEISVLGKGEAPFGIASSPTKKFIDITVNKIGSVTSCLHEMGQGDTVGMRGPLGNGYPLDKLRGNNLVIIGGGFGFSTLRALTDYIIEPENRAQFYDIYIFYGARNPGLLLYKKELDEWESRSDLNLYVTVDNPDSGWKGKTGVVPAIVKELAPRPDNTYALVCGPPVMIKYTLPVLKELGFAQDKIFLSLEMKMKCGLGICGRCNIGNKYVCKDGPVFSLEQLSKLPEEY